MMRFGLIARADCTVWYRNMECGHCGIEIPANRKYCSKTCSNRANARRGEDNPNWLGDRVGYWGLHDWLISNYGQPQECEECGTADPTKRYEWANISGDYRRDRDDFRRLCKSCHNTSDGVNAYQWHVGKQHSRRKMGLIAGKSVSSRYKGVRASGYGTWRATLTVGGYVRNLGSFATEDDAAQAYNKAVRESCGAGAFLNEVPE